MSHADTLAAPTSSPEAQFDSLLRRNADYAAHGFAPGLKMMPAGRTLIVGCVDPRVDPMDIFKLAPGEAAVIRNVGGRVNPALLETLGLLRVVSQSAGANLGVATHLVLLQHTDCGIKHCNHNAPALLSRHLGVETEALDDLLAVDDPQAAVAHDVAALKANSQLPAGFIVSGLVYDVATGKVETVVPPSRLRDDGV